MMSQDENDFKLSSYDFELPPHLLAERPCPERTNAKLLCFDRLAKEIKHQHIFDLPSCLPKGTLLVMNQTKVFPCRLLGKKTSGGACEVFFLAPIPTQKDLFPVLIKARGRRKVGDEFIIGNKTSFSVRLEEISGDGTFLVRALDVTSKRVIEILEIEGKVPIPPYIRDGESDEQDRKDYQTVFAKNTGSVAAPTAGLHFTPALLEKLKEFGIEIAFVTLHVGLGTFAMIKSEDIRDHKMHKEIFCVDEENWAKIQAHSGPLAAVGTTTLRVLESLCDMPDYKAGEWRGTDIFLHPGKKVRSVDALMTNFHLPRSSLLMLVSALVGREKVLELYQNAIDHEYRFFSYGDAMLLTNLRDQKV